MLVFLSLGFYFPREPFHRGSENNNLMYYKATLGIASPGSPLFPGSNCASLVAQKVKYSSSIVSSTGTGLDSFDSLILNHINGLFQPIVCFPLWASREVSIKSLNPAIFLCQGNSTWSWTGDKYVIQTETIKFTRELFTQERMHTQLKFAESEVKQTPHSCKNLLFDQF